jgi:Domain of unknown function (DUF4864)
MLHRTHDVEVIGDQNQQEAPMRRFVISLIILLSALLPLRAETLKDADRKAVESIITSQLEAFARDDGGEAYSFAAPLIQQMFPDPGTFMAMVKRGYAPVYQYEKFEFGESFLDKAGRPAQRVTLTTPDRKRYEAIYTMQQQADGSWKIAGCSLVEVAPLDA